jgi:hypothetical protein
MSSGGGPYKHPCKFHGDYGCENWNWLYETPCTTCISLGRDKKDKKDEEKSS